MSWIATYSGKMFDLVNPEPDGVMIADIAHALSLQCRFAGHVREFYSVAQHSVIVSTMVPRQWALEALLHDAAEAYIGDITRPLKGLLRGEWALIESRIQQAVCERFGLSDPTEWPASIELADTIALAGERRDLLPSGPEWDMRLPPPPVAVIAPVMPPIAERMFLRRFQELMDQRQPSAVV